MNYEDWFIQYANSTDGKTFLGMNLKEYLQKYSHGCLLDVGAGDGQITRILAPIFDRVTAVEPQEKLASMIRQDKDIEVVESYIQDFRTDCKYDVILMSYFLDSLDSSLEAEEILNLLFHMKKDNGIVVGTTYTSNCNWNTFTEIVANELKLKRKGGYEQIEERLAFSGIYKCNVRKKIVSSIWGNTIVDLLDNLSFFFKKNIDEYKRHYDRFADILREYSIFEKGMFRIDVDEIIFEIEQIIH